MATKTKNTKAFYNTEIPSDWVVKELGEIGELKNGINKEKEDFGFGFPMVNLMDVFGINKVYKNNFQLGLVNATERDIKEYSLQKGDVLFIRSSVKPEGVGLTTVICDDLENTTYSGFIIRFRDNGCLDLEYKAHCFFEEGFRRRLLNKSTISANTNINQGALNSLKIPLPPLPEQKAIAQVLSTADAAIHTTEKLIAQKELRKKWLMQQLLTGKKRLKGFDGEWKEVKLSECLSRMANGITYDTEKRTGIPVTRIETISDGVINFNKIGFADSVDNIEDYRLQKGDILYSHINSLSHIGKVAIYDNEEPLYHGMNLLLLRCNEKVNSNFFYQWLVSENGRKKAVSLAKPAVNQASISTTELRKVPISIPTYEEQTAIAQVLQAADKEISLLKAKAEKLREQKKGLMQVLLTGKVRLKTNEKPCS